MLLNIDTSLAIATSGLRTNLLFDKSFPKTPHSIFPTKQRQIKETRIKAEANQSRSKSKQKQIKAEADQSRRRSKQKQSEESEAKQSEGEKASRWAKSIKQARNWAAPTVSYLWPTRTELSRKLSENRKFLGRNISVICPGSCRVTEIQITSCPSKKEFFTSRFCVLKFRRVTIRGAQPSARLSEEICLSEGSAGVSPRALRGLSEGSAGLCGGPREFPRFFGGSDPMLVTLGNCWTVICTGVVPRHGDHF